MRLRRPNINVYGLVASFVGRDRCLSCNIVDHERERLLAVFDAPPADLGFLGINLPPGLECLINTAHLRRIAFLDSMAGIPIEAEDAADPHDERTVGEGDDRVVLRVWLRGDEDPAIHTEIARDDWEAVWLGLEGGARSVTFVDEDAEDLVYRCGQLDAMEVFDSDRFTAEQLERLLGQEPVELPPPVGPLSPRPDDVPF